MMIGIQPLEVFNILLHFVALVGLSICSAYCFVKAYLKNDVKIQYAIVYAISAVLSFITMLTVTLSLISIILGFKV